MTNVDDLIQEFLAAEAFAVVGASNDLAKYGAKVLRSYVQQGRRAFPVNPREETVQGLQAYPSLRDLPEPVHSVSIITPPSITNQVVEDAAASGVRSLWMQPGAESDSAISRAHELGMQVIAGGPCLLVVLGYREV